VITQTITQVTEPVIDDSVVNSSPIIGNWNGDSLSVDEQFINTRNIYSGAVSINSSIIDAGGILNIPAAVGGAVGPRITTSFLLLPRSENTVTYTLNVSAIITHTDTTPGKILLYFDDYDNITNTLIGGAIIPSSYQVNGIVNTVDGFSIQPVSFTYSYTVAAGDWIKMQLSISIVNSVNTSRRWSTPATIEKINVTIVGGYV
jgi:hypothetical protein